MAVVLLLATTPVNAAEPNVEDTDPPPSTLIDVTSLFAVVSPTLSDISVDISRAEEQQLREEAEKAAIATKLAAEKEAERIKHQAAQRKLAQQRSEQKQPDYVRIIGDSWEQCVIYAHRITGNKKIRGYAGDLVAEGYEPRVGAAALERNYGHVSVVVAIDGEWLILHDANWVTGHVTERRVHISTQRGYIY